jgi:hypothetical protein
MEAYLKTGSKVITEIIDSSTGELLDRKIVNNKYLANTKEEFYLMYSSMVIILKQSTDVKMKLFAALLERYSSGQEFAMNGGLKTIIAKETNCKARSLDNAFSFLVKENIVVKIGPQIYKVNPRHVFQGSSSVRNQELKAIIELGCKNC